LPAVNLTRLKQQINELAWQFTRPAEFQRSLHDLLEIYADRVYRPGQTVQAKPLVPAFLTPPLVLRQLELQLFPHCVHSPDAALMLVDQLWSDEYLEPRMLAVAMLGQIPASFSAEILQRLKTWCTPEEEARLIDAALSQGTFRLRQEKTDLWLEMVKEWINSTSIPVQSMGIRALLPFTNDRENENLPPVFRLISPVLQLASAPLQKDLQQVLVALANRSPNETVYFLRQILALETGANTARLVRRIMPSLREEVRASLKDAVKSG
jgi:hypothetical protein